MIAKVQDDIADLFPFEQYRYDIILAEHEFPSLCLAIYPKGMECAMLQLKVVF